MSEVYLILHNIRSSHNVGSIFRTADAAGVAKIILTGYTPAPVNKFGGADKQIAKVALGAEKTVPWERRGKAAPLVRDLRKKGVHIIAVEQSPRAVDYRKIRMSAPTALIFGNEVRGLSKQILSHADVIAEIPMRGKKESLNVSVAVGIMLFKLSV